MTGLLRERLGFTGLAVSDDMGAMKAITDNYAPGDAAVRAVQAGVDLMILSAEVAQQRQARDGLLAAVKDGRISPERLDQAVRNVLTVKAQVRAARARRPRRAAPAHERRARATAPPGSRRAPAGRRRARRPRPRRIPACPATARSRQGGQIVEVEVVGDVVVGRPTEIVFRAANPVGDANQGSMTVLAARQPERRDRSGRRRAARSCSSRASRCTTSAPAGTTPIGARAAELFVGSWPAGARHELRLRVTSSAPYTLLARASFRRSNGSFVHLPGATASPISRARRRAQIDLTPRPVNPPTPTPPHGPPTRPSAADQRPGACPDRRPRAAADPDAGAAGQAGRREAARAAPADRRPCRRHRRSGRSARPRRPQRRPPPPPPPAGSGASSQGGPSIPLLLAGFGIIGGGGGVGLMALVLVLRRRSDAPPRPARWPGGRIPAGRRTGRAALRRSARASRAAGPAERRLRAARTPVRHRPPGCRRLGRRRRGSAPDPGASAHRPGDPPRPDRSLPSLPASGQAGQAAVAPPRRSAAADSPPAAHAPTGGPTRGRRRVRPASRGWTAGGIPAPGERYVERTLVGRGGMGSVFRAYDSRLRRWVALKIMHADLGLRPGFVDRFIREAQVAAMLEHPNIVTVYDIELLGDSIQMVMSWIEGEDLQRVLEREGALAPDRAASILRPDRGGARSRAPAGAAGPPPRHQAVQHHDRPARAGDPDRLRHRPADRRRLADPDRPDGRHAGLHGAGGGAGRRGGRPRRRLRAGRGAVPDADRAGAVPRRRPRWRCFTPTSTRRPRRRARSSRASRRAWIRCSLRRWRRTRPSGSRRPAPWRGRSERPSACGRGSAYARHRPDGCAVPVAEANTG